MIKETIFIIGLLAVVGGIWCLFLSLQTLRIEKIKERSGK